MLDHRGDIWPPAGRTLAITGAANGRLRGVWTGRCQFFLESNAGKVALAWLTGHLQERGFLLLDTLIVTALSKQFGAHYISRDEYRRRLSSALVLTATQDEDVGAGSRR